MTAPHGFYSLLYINPELLGCSRIDLLQTILDAETFDV
jgi:hypothetical protein